MAQKKRLAHCIAVLALNACVLASAATAQQPAKPEHQRFEFTKLLAHWAEYNAPEYVPFMLAAKPDVAQLGFYGAHYWSLAHTPFGKGYPAHFPVQGLAETADWYQDVTGQLQKNDIKVVGHMNVKFLVGDPDGEQGPRGFFHFYRELWDEKQLGPKPVADPLDLLEKDINGKPIVSTSYKIGGMNEYWGCLVNPHWRTVLKAWAKHGIDQGVDGYIANYFYRHDCHCEHCVAGFKSYLSKRYNDEELLQQFGIADLKKHQFEEIVCWHRPEASTPLRREMLRFSQIANKQAFDEVFVEYARSLKPDLLLAQWNHISNFSQIGGDERCMLPAEMWGRDEDYLWYSAGGSAFFTDLANRFTGDITLQARYIRGAFDDKPFTMGKYESTRTRVAIAELAANGGAPMGFYARVKNEEARDVFVQYYGFMRRYDDIYRANRPHAEVLLIYPRSQVHAGNVNAVVTFKKIGRNLLEQHILFDVIPDDLLPENAVSAAEAITAEAPVGSTSYKQYGTVLPAHPASLNWHAPAKVSRIEAPFTVHAAANVPNSGGELDLHLVNYNRTEPEKARSPGRGIQDEKPIAVEQVKVDLVLPTGAVVESVEFITPEEAEPQTLKYHVSSGRLHTITPQFLVYGVVRVHLSE